MTIIVVFIAAVSAVAAWWLSHQRLASKPWLEVGLPEELPRRRPAVPVAKVGLWIFLSIVGAVMAMLVSSFFMRIGADWRALPEPMLLWINSAVLIASSAALQYAKVAARRGQLDGVKNGLLVGGVSARLVILPRTARLDVRWGTTRGWMLPVPSPSSPSTPDAHHGKR